MSVATWNGLLFLAMQGLGAFAAAPALSGSYVRNTLVPAIRTSLQANGALNGQFLRLAFHDCAGKGGCDGCINLNLAENAGLGSAVNELERLFTSNSLAGKISRADFWALAGTVVVNGAATRRPPNSPPNTPPLPDPLPYSSFKYGRVDCATAPKSTTEVGTDFPGANLGSQGVLDYFSKSFNFNRNETVAIMGAHHIGGAHLNASGFRGPWVAPPGGLDGQYYRNLANASLQWAQRPADNSVPVNQRKLQWTPPRPNSNLPNIMMLNADMALYKKITPDATGKVACPYSGAANVACPAATTASQVNLYATNSAKFKSDFAAVFIKMQNVCGRTAAGSPMSCTLSTVTTP